jgi:chromosome segregation ATPase
MVEQQPIINLEWMDEEVRRYRNELGAAQQRINAQDEEIRELARHIEDLEGRLAGQQMQLNRMNVLERALEQYKEEIRLLVEQQETAYQQDRREAARIKLIEQDNVNRSLNDLRKALAAIPRLEEELDLRSAEERRLNDTQLALRQKAMDLEKRIDTAMRPIPYLQEQRARDAKIIAQLEEQVAALTKNADGFANRLLVVEEISQRNRQHVEDLITIRAELQQQQRRFLEEMQLVDQQRQRQNDQWGEAEEMREQRMKEFSDQMRAFVEQYQKVRSALANLESVGERLQREQHEVTELQRLTEERQRAKMEEWEAQAEKRWQREKLLWEQQWHDHDRRNAEQVERLGTVEQRSQANEEQVGYLWESVSDDLRLQSEAVQNLTIRMSEVVEERRNRRRTK